MVISALSENKRFALTENSEEIGKYNEAKADVILKRVTVQRAHEEVRSSSEEPRLAHTEVGQESTKVRTPLS